MLRYEIEARLYQCLCARHVLTFVCWAGALLLQPSQLDAASWNRARMVESVTYVLKRPLCEDFQRFPPLASKG